MGVNRRLEWQDTPPRGGGGGVARSKRGMRSVISVLVQRALADLWQFNILYIMEDNRE